MAIAGGRRIEDNAAEYKKGNSLSEALWNKRFLDKTAGAYGTGRSSICPMVGKI